ncbi:thiamine kinase [Pantoea sp. 1.19]|uniref:thiamine kinase n=1 Tax=Pantoea sp. 1.19 TaxID=1925589 RepID=UPI00094901D9|nr:thiamine kinase [Pantoea sp. 1.19]
MAACSIDPALTALIASHQPAALSAGSFLPLAGLSGNSFLVGAGEARLLVRRTPPLPLPWVDRQREYRQLRQLYGSGLAPQALAWQAPWLLLRWQPGTPLTAAALPSRLPELAQLLTRLHHQPLSGWRFSLPALLARYWQLCRIHPPQWLRAWQRLRRRGAPRPLRLARLHMDVHAGNLLDDDGQLRLIDWEYAGDGDVALELAAICAATPLPAEDRARFIADYAQHNRLSVSALTAAMHRWQPWLALLMACWYQLRAEQAGGRDARQRAAAGWQALDTCKPFADPLS